MMIPPRLVSVVAATLFISAAGFFKPVVFADAPVGAVEFETDDERIARWFYTGKLAEATDEATGYVADHP